MASPVAENSWAKLVKFAQNEPRRIIHSIKVGLALVLVSILHHFRPSFYGFGENIIWAVVTVVIVLELSVGATLGKGLNRMLATGLAGILGLGTHRLATLCGDNGKDVLISAFLFMIAVTVTFMRFSPRIKAKYDYGLLIFMLTFCMVTLSESTDHDLLKTAHERILTIIIGSLIAATICVCIYPIWIGEDLHNQIAGNIVKVADFLEGFGDEYFKNSENPEVVGDKPFLRSYKRVLSSKNAEETKAVLARWEPCHGRFRFRHPWKQYLKIGNLTRLCAYKIEALSVYLVNSDQTPYELRSRIEEPCKNVSLECGKALKESSLMVKKMAKSPSPNFHIAKAKNAAESLKSVLRTNPWEGASPMEIVPAATVASLLIDIVICAEHICEAVDELGNLANFVSPELLHRGTVQPISSDDDASTHVINVNE